MYGVFLGLFYCLPSFGESFLTAKKFPKTFEDLSFTSKMAVLRDGYLPYSVEYDANGVCISGCAYKGITIKEDMAAVDSATQQMADLIAQESAGHASLVRPSKPVTEIPVQNESSVLSPLPPAQNDFEIPPLQQDDVAVVEQEIPVHHDWCRNGLSTKLPLRYPIDMTNFRYMISSDFGFRQSSPNGSSFHPALDISCPVGTPVYATADGVVVNVANQTDRGGAGKYINIKHENGLVSQYLHLNQVLVAKGDTVSACQQIATSGNSGISKNGTAYAPHLDYRIRFDNAPNTFVDILCPCKKTNRKSEETSESNIDATCAHSLFNREYRFKSQSNKRSKWRVDHGHCMISIDDLLPDERL